MFSIKKLSCDLARASLSATPKGVALGGVSKNLSQPLASLSTRPKTPSSKNSKPPRRAVFISQSTDIFSNLALEDWLYRNWSFKNRNVLFLWRNSPCVVIGRHQNPRTEANLPYLESAGVPVARRGSGGGAVYHDHGNLNCTFFTSRERYNRRTNLELICNVLNQDFGIEAEANHRDDIIVGHENKVSGSAAKLGRTTAYHHCTLLVKTDRQQLRLALQGDKSINSRATASVPASITNLGDLVTGGDLTVENLMSSIGQAYLNNQEEDPMLANGFTLINPTDDWFPGLQQLQDELRSTQWLEGKTPRFSITRSISLPHYLAAPSNSINITVQAYNGAVEEIRVAEGEEPCPEIQELIHDASTALKGIMYSSGLFNDISNRLRLPLPLQRSVV